MERVFSMSDTADQGFFWCVGVEDTFIPQTRAGIRQGNLRVEQRGLQTRAMSIDVPRR